MTREDGAMQPDSTPPGDGGATGPRPGRPRLTRRQALGLGGGAALAGGSALTLGLAHARGGGEDAAGSVVAFHGTRQAGVTTARQSHALLALYDLQATRRDELVGLLRAVSARARLLTAGALERPTTQGDPPPDSGTLGAGGDPQGLTITLGFGGGPFDRPGDPFGIAERRPRALKPMPSFPGDDLDPAQTDADLLLQIGAEDPLVAMHALRDVERHVRGALTPRVVNRGSQRRIPVRRARGEVADARGLLGFKDGTANPSTGDGDLIRRLVWLDGSDAGEPAWTRDGTYLVLRKIRERLEAWDRETLRSQERIIGRRRDSGAPLDGRREADEPAFADQEGERTPLDSHVRRANPRLPGSESQRILRRSYPYFDGYDQAGLLDAGLLFICFQRDPVAQFEAVKQRLSPAAARPQSLDEYLTCVGGGYFFCPHGATGEDRFVGDRLFA